MNPKTKSPLPHGSGVKIKATKKLTLTYENDLYITTLEDKF